MLKTLLTILLSIMMLFSNTSLGVELLGAGATFPYPLYSKMFDAYYKEKTTKINYQAIGSGGGIRQLQNKTVDFGGSDAFLNDKKMKKMAEPVIHIPIVAGAVALAYNLPGNPVIKLTPTVLADIYLGKITKWNDEQLQKINPDIKLPKIPIASVQRSDGSGTTFIFTDYLSKVSDPWKTKVGTGKAVNWPTGMAGKGNSGVAGLIKQIPGAIGYVSSVYGLQNNMPMAKVQNKSGRFTEPTLEAITQAANNKEIPQDTRASLTDTDARFGYPISGFTWILLYQDQKYNKRNLDKAQETVNLIRWMITEGQRFAIELNYAPLPDSVIKLANKQLDKITYNGNTL